MTSRQGDAVLTDPMGAPDNPVGALSEPPAASTVEPPAASTVEPPAASTVEPPAASTVEPPAASTVEPRGALAGFESDPGTAGSPPDNRMWRPTVSR